MTKSKKSTAKIFANAEELKALKTELVKFNLLKNGLKCRGLNFAKCISFSAANWDVPFHLDDYFKENWKPIPSNLKHTNWTGRCPIFFRICIWKQVFLLLKISSKSLEDQLHFWAPDFLLQPVRVKCGRRVSVFQIGVFYWWKRNKTLDSRVFYFLEAKCATYTVYFTRDSVSSDLADAPPCLLHKDRIRSLLFKVNRWSKEKAK